MIIHCTQKLAAKLPCISETALTETHPLGSWHANLYVIDRRQCVMFCHDATRFVLLVAGLKKQDFSNLEFRFNDLFANTLLKLDFEHELIHRALSHLDALQFDTVCNRSVQGSMRTVRMAELEALLMDVPDVMQLPIYSTSARLNKRPVTIKGMKKSECLWPYKAMRSFIEKL
ncbi:MAG: DUF6933 domain-containing protein [Gammaproteobacteria bacterium]